METTEYLSVKKVTREVPLSRQRVWEAVANGELRAIQLKPRGRILITREDLSKWLASKVVQPARKDK